MSSFRSAARCAIAGLCSSLLLTAPASASSTKPGGPATTAPPKQGPQPTMVQKANGSAPAAPAMPTVPAPKTDAELPAALKALVDPLAAQEAFSGAILVARGSKVLATGVWGQADRTWNVPNRLDTRFNLGSMNKMFTAVAVLQLVEQGKLSLEDPVSKYLGEDWLPAEVAKQVTVRQLLNHTSGLGSYFTEQFQRSSRALFRTVEDFKPLVRDGKRAFPPGTSWAYGNSNYVVLGAIIEKVTGRSYFDHVREHVYKPAGMKDTECYDLDTVVPNLAVGYVRQETPAGVVWRNNLFEHVIRGGPAGGGYSTVEDLHRFVVALRAGKLVSQKTLEQMFTQEPLSGERAYGLGFQIFPKHRIVGHSGGFVGISSNLDIYLDNDVVTVVLTNQDRSAMRVSNQLRTWLGKPKS
ncbi:serine hydrolase [Pyxidicoccus fallax]|uniref:Serine hydrolase n=1 Tax=Pyxidicoccus fallax TaxID=394095 RepID=A0A848LG79_9BACT|nr:serine hydrolase domain-containing protein [Pyxidicoccus fallax]NMO16175.1 serine hydrolase [Pyxidicoccus fallax]NPC77635.1 serine hydrolase [Pyxidicoccus fallax]